MPNGPMQPVGLYEKALPADLSWDERLGRSAEAGFDYVEMSIDESDGRLGRLDWSGTDIAAMRSAMANSGVPVMTLGLSAHRRYPLGSADPALRDKALVIFRRAIDLAAELGVKAIQVMGYDVFYEPSTPATGERFLDGLRQGACWAAAAGVMLALENVDVPFADSIDKALSLARAVDSPWVQVYPDMGNAAAAGHDPVEQLRGAGDRIVGVHIKDALPGVVRGVPFGAGIVPFHKVFMTLANMRFCGPMTVEMWADMNASDDSFKAVAEARRFVAQLMTDAWNGATPPESR